jgi:hypothetical protein
VTLLLVPPEMITDSEVTSFSYKHEEKQANEETTTMRTTMPKPTFFLNLH